MMSRWCDQSIPDERHFAFSSGPLEVAVLFGTLVAETILASVHVRAHKQAGHMDASDLIKTLQNTLQGGGRPHMENHCGGFTVECRRPMTRRHAAFPQCWLQREGVRAGNATSQIRGRCTLIPLPRRLASLDAAALGIAPLRPSCRLPG